MEKKGPILGEKNPPEAAPRWRERLFRKKGPIFGEKNPPEAAPRWRDRLLKKKGSIVYEKHMFYKYIGFPDKYSKIGQPGNWALG